MLVGARSSAHCQRRNGLNTPSSGGRKCDKSARGLYGGPCPPTGRHRYFHKLYALDTKLELDAPTKADVEEAMEGHVIESAELVGTYEKQGR